MKIAVHYHADNSTEVFDLNSRDDINAMIAKVKGGRVSIDHESNLDGEADIVAALETAMRLARPVLDMQKISAELSKCKMVEKPRETTIQRFIRDREKLVVRSKRGSRDFRQMKGFGMR